LLPGCILLNVTSDPINEREPAETLSVAQHKSGYGLIAAMTDIPVAIKRERGSMLACSPATAPIAYDGQAPS
jgi:hypothetical protein